MPDVHLKCYTASEIHHMTTLSGLTHEQVLRELQAAGLGSLPGRRRRDLRPPRAPARRARKEDPEIWFHVHDTAHRLGIPTHCTMLYGHVETYEERVDHLLRLREQQDRTGGFLAFIPLAFHPENTVFERRGWRHTTGVGRPQDARRLAAAARQHPERQGVLDHDGHAARGRSRSISAPTTCRARVVREEIFQAAGAPTGTEQKVEELVRFVRDAGRIPVQRDTLYNELRRW